MPRIIVVTRDGTEHTVDGEIGLSMMEVIRENGFDELLALCGGCCSCATCHVHVDAEYMDKLAPMQEDENELLDGSMDRDERSRLSCQIELTANLDGIRVMIAAED